MLCGTAILAHKIVQGSPADMKNEDSDILHTVTAIESHDIVSVTETDWDLNTNYQLQCNYLEI